MSDVIIPYRFKVLGNTAAALAADTGIPRARELVVETDTGRMKLGDGFTGYAALPYIGWGVIDFAGIADGSMLVWDATNSKFVLASPAESLFYRRDDLTAGTGDNKITLDKEPYQSSLTIYKNGELLLESDYVVSTLDITLNSVATAGDIYSVLYWATEAVGSSVIGGGSTDPDFASVASLLHMDGTNGSTTFTDQKGVTWTANGNAQLSTAQPKFGAAALALDGNGDYISTAASADFGFGTGDFTVEGWFYRTGTNTNAFLADFRVVGGNSFVVWCSQSGTANALGYSSEAGTNFQHGIADEFTLNTYVHWAISRQSGTVRGFVGGGQKFTATDNRDFGGSQGVRIGSSITANQGAVGYIDDIRITKGVARYTAAFTPPSAPFPNA